jgi:pimeloyl-ACP methyl ester carboxylesterase
MTEMPRTLTRPGGATIAYHKSDGAGPGVIFLGGYSSDMTGTKAMALEAFCQARGQAFLRLDYQGHGQSSGCFEDGTIGLWADDALAALDALTDGPQILVGSSMGGWIMMLLARARPARVAAMIGIAAAPDFVLEMWEEFSPEVRAALECHGIYRMASEYSDEPSIITMVLIEDGRSQLVLDRPFPFAGPVRLLQGMADPDVHWRTALRIAERIEGEDVEIALVKDGDHRLSRAADLARLGRTVAEVIEALG